MIYDYTLKKIGGGCVDISTYMGRTLLIVNVASFCNFTRQYKNLQMLNEKFSSQNFSLLAFPCNDFFNQEPGFEEEIIDFCNIEYGVKFDVFKKIKIRGVDAHPLYKHLEGEISPVIGSKGLKARLFQLFCLIVFLFKERRLPNKGEVVWNFHKFIIGGKGQIAGHFPSDCDPLDQRLIACIERELNDHS